MELNWELCRIFYQVARCRNFSRAAAMLFTSQPAVSRSMAAVYWAAGYSDYSELQLPVLSAV